MSGIFTVDDLLNASTAEIEATVASLDPWSEIVEHLKTLNKKSGRRKTRRFECHHCEGTGEIEIPPRKMYVFHPSSVNAKACGRKLQLDLMGFEDKVDGNIDERLRLIFNTGHAIHEQLQGYAYRVWGSDRFVAEASDGDEELLLWGSNDGIIQYDHCRCMLEIKTINDNGFQSLGMGPKPDHIWQATIYMHIFDVPFCAWWYYNKNTSVVQQFVQPFSQTNWDNIRNKLLPIIEASKKKELWPKEASKWTCERCVYKPLCFGRKELQL